VLIAREIAKPHPRAEPTKSKPKDRRRIWEKPWLWVGLVGAVSIVVLVVAQTVPSSPSVSVAIDGSRFGVR
jgi:hypothetical protein